MSHLALYRRLRPKDFKGVIGQEHAVRILKNQLLSGTTSHAYLFCGTRGTGKTSMAKILAKALNCQMRGDEVDPCGTCESCLSAAENRNLNIIEIDAASNNGVDNVREIREEVKYPPQDGGVKVYIIDEVHMLSTGAFNALLKTLEEPPVRVVFILATTDAQKIPATILSRCVRLDFKRIPADEMAHMLHKAAEEQNLAVTEAALRYICAISDGAMRDAYSLLDQCISFYQGHIKSGEGIDVGEVLALTGAVDNAVFFELMDALIAFDSSSCLAIIEDIVNLGRDVGRFISDFTHHLRNLLVSGSLGGSGGFLDMSQSAQEKYLAQAKAISSERLIGLIHEFCELSASARYRGSFNERIMLECLCIKLCNPQSSETQDLSVLMSRIEKLENAQVSAASAPTPRAQVEATKPKAPNIEKSAPEDIPGDIKSIISEWGQFNKSFPEPLRGLLKETRAAFLGESLCIIVADDFLLPFVKDQESVINQALIDKYGNIASPMFISEREYNGKQGIKTEKANDRALQEKLGNIDIEWE